VQARPAFRKPEYLPNQLRQHLDFYAYAATAVAASARQQKLTVLYGFRTYDAGRPEAPLTVDDQGNIYGAAAAGGPSGFIFRLDAGGNWAVLHAFNGLDGSYPNGGLLQDSAGNLYGTTDTGGMFDCGNLQTGSGRKRNRPLRL
jgi:uncharacterized repeat protein (TIGR03803 family)